ncbi:hypothetical protein [Clostridium ganghwense]|uniref:Uncharacterized protein n=1 Tax=Clostridium ganghwense TaxID=312089 RepID=A0ABT4CU60_9CLOT|nr:hypothetical protein [Clostridium ganghwense]MCY6372610.1 hypothetical protein [Clostridium ganghwense]
MQKGKKGDINGQEVNIGTKRTKSSNIQHEKNDVRSKRNDK